MSHCAGNGRCCQEPCYTLSMVVYGVQCSPPFLCHSCECCRRCCPECSSTIKCCGTCATSPCGQCCWLACVPCRVPFLCTRLCIGCTMDVCILCFCTPFRFEGPQWCCNHKRDRILFDSIDAKCCVLEISSVNEYHGHTQVVWYEPPTCGAWCYMLCCMSLNVTAINRRQLVDKCPLSKALCPQSRTHCQTGRLWTSIGNYPYLKTEPVIPTLASQCMERL